MATLCLPLATCRAQALSICARRAQACGLQRVGWTAPLTHSAGPSGRCAGGEGALPAHLRSSSRCAVSAAAAAAGSAADDGPGAAPGAGASSSGGAAHAPGGAALTGFASLERLLTSQFGGGPGGDWREVEGCWVLHPPEGAEPRALVHFTGGAFVAAAAQLAYRPLLEALAARGALVVVTPCATQLDHLKAVDEIYFKFARCLKQLGPEAAALPVYGLGHSLGALMQLLLSSRYLLSRAGNVLMAFNNRPATDSIPLLSPYIAPSVRMLGPLLSQLATSPLRASVESWLEALKSASPSSVKQILPVLEQLTPMYLDISTGVAEFTPPPEESRRIIREGYTVPRNLLLRFVDDTIDETPALASTLQQSAAVSAGLELTVKTLPGDHVRPLQQDLNSLSPDLVRLASQATAAAVSQSEGLLGQLGAFAARAGLSEATTSQLEAAVKAGTQVASMIGTAVATPDAASQIEALADEVAAFAGLEVVGEPTAVRALPPPPPPAPAA